MPDFNNIPGGADTQIAQQSGNPEAVGLSPNQSMQLGDVYQQSIDRGNSTLRSTQEMQQGTPIPTGLEDLPPEVAPETQPPAPVEGQQELESIDITLPTGEPVTIEVPVGMSDEDIRYWLIDQGEQGFEPDGSVVDRAVYGFQQAGNITTDLGYYAKSHFPFLADEIRIGEDGISFNSADEIYGADWDELSPQQKRDRMKEVDAQKLKEQYPDIHPKNLGAAGTVGAFGKAILDPVGLTPVGKGVQGFKAASVGVNALKGAGAGAAWGATAAAAEQLGDTGTPTTLNELEDISKKVAKNAAIGAVGGGVLLGGAKAIHTGIVDKTHRLTFNPHKAVSFARKKYWPNFWELQMQGKSAGEAGAILRKKFNMSIDDEWRLRQSLVDVDQKLMRPTRQGGQLNISEKKANEIGASMLTPEPATRRQGTAIYSPAMDAKDAAQRMSDAKLAQFGDPILQGKRQQFVDDFLRPIAGVVKDISPRVYRRLVDMEGAIYRSTRKYHKQFQPFMRGFKKLNKIANPADMRRFASYLYNGDSVKAKTIWLQHGLEGESFDLMRKGLDDLGMEMEQAGIKGDFLQSYFPRIVKDYQGFMQHVNKSPKLGGLARKLKQASLDKQRALTDGESADIINRYLIPKKKPEKKTIRSAKKRTVDTVEEEVVKFYEDPATSLEFHLREAISKAERAKFFGKHMVMEDGVDDIGKSVGGLVNELGLDPDSTLRLADVLRSRFGGGEQAGSTALSGLRQLTGGTTLGNPLSALKQLGDIPSSMLTQGVANTLHSMFRKVDPELNADVLGYMLEMAQELDIKGGLAAARRFSHGLYKWGGFKTVDRFGKNTVIKAAQRKLMASQKTPKSRMEFARKYGDIYSPDELRQLADDVNNGVMSDLLKSHINAEVMRIQPISRSQMPKKYLDHPNGRMFYQFRTWGLNQMELFRQEVLRGIRSGSAAERAKAAYSGVLWLAGIGTTNAAITQGQRWLTGREAARTEDLPDEMLWQTLGNFALFDRYGMEKTLQKGDIEEYFNTWLPPSITIPGTLGVKVLKGAFSENPYEEKDIRDILKASGGIGRIIEWTAMGGAEDYNEKRRKERETEFNKLLNGSAYAQ